MAALNLHCCTQAFYSCGKWGILSSCGTWASHCSGFSCCRAWAQGAQGLWVVAAHRPQSTGSVNCDLAVPWHVVSSWTRTEPVSPELAGRLFTTELPGKPWPESLISCWGPLHFCLFCCVNKRTHALSETAKSWPSDPHLFKSVSVHAW